MGCGKYLSLPFPEKYVYMGLLMCLLRQTATGVIFMSIPKLCLESTVLNWAECHSLKRMKDIQFAVW